MDFFSACCGSALSQVEIIHPVLDLHKLQPLVGWSFCAGFISMLISALFLPPWSWLWERTLSSILWGYKCPQRYIFGQKHRKEKHKVGNFPALWRVRCEQLSLPSPFVTNTKAWLHQRTWTKQMQTTRYDVIQMWYFAVEGNSLVLFLFVQTIHFLPYLAHPKRSFQRLWL